MSRPIITAKIDVTEIVKAHLFNGKKQKQNGKLPVYLDLAFFEKSNDYSDGYIVQSIPKEAREKGERGPILGNYKAQDNAARQANAPQKQAPSVADDGLEDSAIPF